MVLPVHLPLSADVAIVDWLDQYFFIDSPSLKQAMLQPILLFQGSHNNSIERIQEHYVYDDETSPSGSLVMEDDKAFNCNLLNRIHYLN